MKNNKQTIGFLILFLLSSSVIKAQWQVMESAFIGGNVNCVSVNGNILYSGTGKSVYVSSDRGNEWKRLATNLPDVNSILAYKNSLFVGTVTGLYRISTDGSVSQQINLGVTTSVNSIVLKDSIIYVGTGNGIFLSGDGGTNWSAMKNMPQLKDIEALKVEDGYIIAAGNSSTVGDLYVSSDNGNSWKTGNLDKLNLGKIVRLFTNDTMWIAGTTAGRLFYSKNKGASWDKIWVLSNESVNGLCVYKDQIFVTSDAHALWTNIPSMSLWYQLPDEVYNSGVNRFEVDGNNIYAATKKRGVLIHDPKNNDWISSINGINEGEVSGFMCSSTKLLILSNMGDLFISSDSGNSYTQVFYEDGSHYFNAVNIVNDTLIAAADGSRLGYSIDYGKNWKYIHHTVEGTISRINKINGKFIILTKDNKIYLSGEPDSAWKRIDSAFEFYSNSNLIVLGNNILISNYFLRIDCIYCDEAIFLSSNLGKKWEIIPHRYIAKIITNGTTAWGTTMLGVMRSSDNGLTWEITNKGLPEVIYPSITMSDNYIYVMGANYILYQSSDNGNNWVPSISAPTNSGGSFDATGKYMFFYSEGKLYKISTASLNNVNSVNTEDRLNTMSYKLAQNYPNPFNPSTTITFSVPKETHVTLRIYDILGREITTLVNEKLQAGSYSKVWNATGYSSGVYFYRIEAGEFTETKKINLLK